DDRLVGKSLEQSDLLVSERTNLEATGQDHADRLALAQQRHAERGPVADSDGIGVGPGELLPAGGKVVDVNRLSVHHSALRDSPAVELSKLQRNRDRPMMG